MGSGFAKKKKEARQLQEQFEKFSQEMKQTSSEGSAGGGMVTITLNGEHKMTSLKIDPECVDKEEVEALIELIQAAYHNALEKIESKTPKLPGLPGLDSLFSK